MLEGALEEIGSSASTFSHLSVAKIDFSHSKIQSAEWREGKVYQESESLYDLASVTKAMTLFPSFLLLENYLTNSQNEDLIWAMEHRASLPNWALLSKKNWKDYLQHFSLQKSTTQYSDLSALRYMLEVEKRFPKTVFSWQAFYSERLKSKKIFFWRDLSNEQKFLCPPTGFRHQKLIRGEVNDANAYNLGIFCTHAGLFATIVDLAKWWLDLENEFSWMKKLLQQVDKTPNDQRFIWGLDRTQASLQSLSGSSSPYVVGHLGFTGTSVWFDCEKRIGYLLLSNATSKYCYERNEINFWRRKLGKRILTS